MLVKPKVRLLQQVAGFLIPIPQKVRSLSKLWEDPGFQWKMDVLKQETLDSIARLDERRGIVHIRRHLAASPLFKGLEDFRHTRIEMLRAETVSDLFAIMDRITAQWGSY